MYQPWAGFIVAGIKENETRGQPINHRGRIAIHAGLLEFTPDMGIWPQLSGQPINPSAYKVPLYRGAIVGFADLVAVEHVTPKLVAGLSELEHALGNYDTTLGPRYVWRMENPVQLTMPIPMRGKQGLWKVDLSAYGYEGT